MVESIIPKKELPDASQHEEIAIKAVGNIRQKLESPFLSQTRNWDNKDNFDIPEDLIKGITEKWNKPSKIQGVAIPLIVNVGEDKCYDNLIAQSKNGSGKTGTYVIGSLLRVDRAVKSTQIIVLAHTRELGNQIT